MSRDISHGLLFSSIAAFAFVAFVCGFAMATSVPSDRVRDPPIINPRAWDEAAPQPAAWAPTQVARCEPWEISEVAAEEMLREMVRRGWRPPTHGDVAASFDPDDTSRMAAPEPDAQLSASGAGRDSSLPAAGAGAPQADAEAAIVSRDPAASPAAATPAILAAPEPRLN